MPRGERTVLDPIGHAQTPPELRGALWWLHELAVAEHAVTCAARAVDMGGSAYAAEVDAWRLDAALDHLADVEGRVDAILDHLRATAPGWVADAAAARYVSHMAWDAAASAVGYSASHVKRAVAAALAALDASAEG